MNISVSDKIILGFGLIAILIAMATIITGGASILHYALVAVWVVAIALTLFNSARKQ